MHYYGYEDDVHTGRRGYGGISHVYIGTPNQRGHGIGSFLGGLFRRALPFLKIGAKALGKEALRTGVKVAGDMIEKNMSLKDSVHTRVREAGGNLKRKASEKLDTLMHGSGYKTHKIARNSHSNIGRVTSRTSSKKKKSSKNKKKKKTVRKTIKKKKKKNTTKKKILRTVADIFR